MSQLDVSDLSVDQAIVDLALPASFDHRVTVNPLWPSTNVRALGAVQAVHFHRLEDAALIIRSNDPDATGDDYGMPTSARMAILPASGVDSMSGTVPATVPATEAVFSLDAYAFVRVRSPPKEDPSQGE